MKTKVITLGALIAAVPAMLGTKAAWSHLTTVREEIRTTVREATPADYEVKRIKTLIGDMSKDVLAFGDKIAEIESTAAAQREDAQKLEQRLAADRADLLTERNLLSQEGEVFTIRGTAYSRGQIEASAQARLAQIQRDQAALETKKQAIERLKAAVREGQVHLQKAVAVRDSKIQELEVLAAELANAELRNELEALSAPLRDGVLPRSQSELAESMKSFAHRVRDAKRQAEAATQTTSAPALIPHESSAPPGLLEQIDRALVPAAPAPAKKP
jgi:peptidoglycan hydrolase CwlO-like protein